VLPVVALTLSGCFGHAMDERAVIYNDQVEAAENDLLLANIVRASFRHPLYFTAFSDIHSPGSNSFGGLFAVPLAVQGQTGLTVSPTLQVNENVAQFGVGEVNSSDFIRGISTPVGVQTVDLLRQRTSHNEHLLSLFIGRIEIADGHIFVNNPRDEQARRFQNLLRLLIALGLTTETAKEPVNVGLPVKAPDIKPLDKFSDLSAPDVELVRLDKDTYRVVKVRTIQRFCFARPPMLLKAGMPLPSDDFIKRALAVTCKSWIQGNVAEPSDTGLDPDEILGRQVTRYRHLGREAWQRPVDANLIAFVKKNFADVPLGLWPDNDSDGERTGHGSGATNLGLLSIDLRSPEAMLLYLGDIAAIQRHQNAAIGPKFLTDQSYDSIRSGECQLPAAGESGNCDHVAEELVFRIERDEPRGDDLAAFDYMGKHYSVPSGSDARSGRSSETLSILSTLLSLYRSASDLPKAVPVRIIPE